MTKSYEFNWQKHVPEFMQEGAPFDRFDEVRKRKLAVFRGYFACAIFGVLFFILHINFMFRAKVNLASR